MPRPRPTPVLHFTRVEHIPTIIDRGLLGDNLAQQTGSLRIEVGNAGIKDQRRRRRVPVVPGGAVADYVPFYFAARSPMMSAIHHGRVPTYQDGCDSIVYLVSSVERLVELGPPVLVTDRNAVLAHAAYRDDVWDALDEDIDWELMRARYWGNTDDQPDRRERRMAECLVYEAVAWKAIEEVVAKTTRVAGLAEAAVARAGHSTPVTVRSDWYF